MSETLIKVNDWGTILDITVTELVNNNSMIVNLSTVTIIKIWLQQYNTPIKSVMGTFYTDGTDGRIRYVLKLGDITVAGPCKMQIELTFGLAGHWYSNWVTFNVEDS
jgi:hypothetical protein